MHFNYFVSATSNDPCQTAKQLPNFELRLKVYKIDPNRDIPMCDRYFINEPGEWFRTEDGIEMVNTRTSYFECGTQYSIYMQGIHTHPHNHTHPSHTHTHKYIYIGKFIHHKKDSFMTGVGIKLLIHNRVMFHFDIGLILV